MLNIKLVLFIIKNDLRLYFGGLTGGIVYLILFPIIIFLIYGFLINYIFGLKYQINQNGLSTYSYIFIGLLICINFIEAINKASSSISEKKSLIRKSNFSTLIFPISAATQSLFQFILGIIILLIFDKQLTIILNVQQIIFYLLFVFSFFLSLCAVSSFFAYLTILYSKLQKYFFFLGQFLIFGSPVFYVSLEISYLKLPIDFLPTTVLINFIRDIILNKVQYYNFFYLISLAFFSLVLLFAYYKTEKIARDYI